MSSNKIEKSSEGNVTAPFTTLLPSCIVTSSSPSPMISTSAAVVPTASAATFLGSNNASSSRSRNGTEELTNHSRGLGSTSPYMNEAARNCSSILNGCEQLSGKLTSGNLSPNLYNPSTFHSDYVRLLDSLMRNHHQIPTLPFQSTIPIPTSGTVPPLQRLLWPNHSEDGTSVSRSSALPSVSSSSNVNNRLLGTSTSLKTPLSISVTHATTDTIPSVPVDRLGSYNSNSLIIPVVQRVHKDSQSFESSASTVTSKTLAATATDGSFRPDINGNPTLFQLSKITSENKEEEKIDVCNVKDFLLKESSDVSSEIGRGHANTQYSDNDCPDESKEDGSTPMYSQLGCQCSRTVPNLMKYYAKHKRLLSSSLSVNLSVGGQSTPPCSPISPGTLSVPPTNQRYSLEASTMTSPPDRSVSSDGSISDSNHRFSSGHSFTSATSGYSPKMSSPSSKSNKRKEDKETAQAGESTVRSDSMSRDSPVTSTRTAHPSRMTYPAHWPINPIAPYWIPPSHITGVDASVNSTNLGLGYQMATDQITGHLFLVPRPHPLSDPSGHGLMWTGYGGMPAPPVMMTPQQLLLGDPHYPHSLHAPIMPMRSNREPSKDDPKKPPTSQELDMTALPPHFLFPPSTLPYYYPPPPSHASSYNLSPYSHQRTSLLQTLSAPSVTTASLSTPSATVTSAPVASVWSRGTSRPIDSPGLRKDSKSNSNLAYSEPPIDLTQRKAKSPQAGEETSAETTVTKKEVPSLSIKKEIKQELLSPPAVSEAISLQSLPKTLKVKAEHVPVPYSGVDESNINLRNKEEVLETSQRPSSTEEEIKAVPLTRPKEEIDSSGLDLLFDTLLQHGDRLAPSPVIEDSDSSSCEQMPHLERAARTPSPRASPISDESLPPVLTPSAPIPVISSKISSPSSQQVTNSVFEPSEVSENAQVENSNCFSVLCALAEQRILEEQQNNSALSSLAELALANPSCEPILDKTLHDINSPNHQIPNVTPTLSPSYEPLPNITCDLLLNQSCSSLPDDAEFTDSDSQEQPTPYMCDEEKVKESDMNRNYKSPRSEREVKAYIANRMQQSNKEINYFPAYQLDDMAPSEVDMRMKLADLQRQYKEKQKELSKLPSRKLSSKKCRGRPRKPKKKSLTKDVCGSLKDESEPDDEEFNGFTPNSLSKDDEESKSSCVPELISCPLNNVLKTDEETSDEEPLLDELPAIIDTMSLATKNEESDEEDAIIDTMSLATKNEESDEEDAISESSLRRDSVQVETSVESSTSDVELHPFSSSSKKRKPGRPKKHSPTKYDATETIVAKKHKSLSYLLLSQKSKMKPKLKAELIVKDKQEEGESEGWSICKVRSNTSEEDSDNVVKKKVMSMNSKNLKLSKHANGNAIHHHGAPRGRAALSRNSILRDKETRKTSFEKNSQMQQLFRSLKRHSKIADPEHDESGDERTDDDDKSDEEQQHETKVSFKIMSENGTSEPMKSLKQEELCVKIESNCDTESIEEEPKTVPKMYIKTEPCYFPSVETPPKIDAPKMNEKETKDPSSVCSLQVEDLVKGARVLILQEGLLYAGYLKPIDPPDVYGVLVDGERGTRPHICCQEQLLNQAWKEVKPGSTRFLTEGTRVCAFWSQQYRGLYTGCVAAASSPNHEGNHNLVNVEFDDGDSGRIHVDDIRLLPQDFPIIDHDPNPLLTLNKRKRRPTDEESLRDTRHFESKRRTQSCPTPPPLKLGEENGQTSNTIVDKGSVKPLSVLQESHMSAPIEISPVNENAINEPRKKHKKRRHSESHKHKHKHKRKRKDLFPTVEPGDNELRMRIKSPPPHNKTKSNHKDASSEEDSSTSDKEEVVRNSKKPSGRKKRSSSEKSRIAPFLLERQLWGWSGTGYKRPGCKGKGKKEFYKEIVRGKERIRVGDCAVFLSSGSPDRPFIGHIDFLWESWGGNMVVKVRWFYHMDETTCGVDKKLAEPRGALFASGHTDENDVQTISHKCAVVSLAEYRVRRAELEKKKGPSYENYDLYYLAGHYDASMGRITMEPGVS